MLTFVPFDAPLGAFVHGFDRGTVIDETFVADLAAGLLEHGVLVFRDRELAAAELVELGQAFGDLEILPEPEKRHPDHPEIFNLTNVRADGELVEFEDPQSVFLRGTQRWHTDSSFRETPALCTMLYAVEVPAHGGQTQFADMRGALDLLSADDRSELASLRLVHSYEFSRANNPGRMDPMTDAERAKYPPVEHPWIRTLPGGTESLFMGGHVSHVAGRNEDEGRELIAEITERATVSEVVYEHRWQAHDLVVWDNRSTLHRLMPYDIANDRRVMRRITVAGTERP